MTLPFDHCVTTPGVVDVGSVVDYPRRHCGQNPISIQECFDDVDFLKPARVFLFRGAHDKTYAPGAVENVAGLLGQMIEDPAKSIKFVGDQPFDHILPLKSTPYFGQTEPGGYDGPAECMKHVFDGPIYPGKAVASHWMAFDQTEFADSRDGEVGFQKQGWIYIPKTCTANANAVCRLMIRPDECAPPNDFAPDVAAFADYAEQNGIVLLHPCVGGAVDKVKYPNAPDIEQGRMDVYGQLCQHGADCGGYYVQQSGPHMRAIGKMVRRILGKPELSYAPAETKGPEAAAQQVFFLHQVDLPDHKCFEASSSTKFDTKGIKDSGPCPASYNTVDKSVTVAQCPDGLTSIKYCTPINVTIETKGEQNAPVIHPMPTLKIDRSSGGVATAGCSNTADFSAQFHVAFSSLVKGSCIFSGMPYHCAVTRFTNDYMVPKSNSTAAGIHCPDCDDDGTLIYDHCKNHPHWVELDKLYKYAETANDVDDPKIYLADARVFSFGPTRDRCYQPPAMENVADFHLHYATNSSQVLLVEDQPFPHTLPGNSTPYFNHSEPAMYDGPGECVKHVFGRGKRLFPSDPADKTHQQYWLRVNATEFVTDLGIGARPSAWLFRPPQCEHGTCQLLILPGGCNAFTDDPPAADGENTDDDFARYGMANGINVLKPCLSGGPIDAKRFPLNHENLRGMIDVYGQLSADYATQKGDQMQPLGKMLKRLMGVDEV
jgi:hypothetical protein